MEMWKTTGDKWWKSSLTFQGKKKKMVCKNMLMTAVIISAVARTPVY